jgi:hypothetical protein
MGEWGNSKRPGQLDTLTASLCLPRGAPLARSSGTTLRRSRRDADLEDDFGRTAVGVVHDLEHEPMPRSLPSGCRSLQRRGAVQGTPDSDGRVHVSGRNGPNAAYALLTFPRVLTEREMA